MATSIESLAALGWNDIFESSYQQTLHESETAGLKPARIVGEGRGLFTLSAGGPATFLGVIAGRLRHLAGARLDLPAVGDWVLCSHEGDSERAIIHSIFPRQTCITRKQAGGSNEDQVLASNVDRAIIVTSANAELNPARLQRYLTAVREGGVEVEIALSKIDLCPDYASLIEQLRASVPDVPMTGLSVVSKAGLDELRGRLMPGRTYVFLGSSGVGKSTLLNHLMGREVMDTGGISGFEDKGRHTTSSRHLFSLPSGALVIDTPGLREIRLGGFEQGLYETYDDIFALAAQCKFSDCRHESEPGCAVREAMTNGSLSEERWSWYIKLQKEVDYQLRKESGEHARNTKARWKKIHQMAKQVPKRKRWEF